MTADARSQPSSLEPLARALAAQQDRVARINDPWELLRTLAHYGLRTRTQWYTRTLRLIAREPLAGIRDILIRQAKRVFQANVRSIRSDLRALDEARRLDEVLKR
jgi:hypothetical protein